MLSLNERLEIFRTLAEVLRLPRADVGHLTTTEALAMLHDLAGRNNLGSLRSHLQLKVLLTRP